MIQVTCDGCRRRLDPERDVRYVVRLEVYASLNPADLEIDDERDYLQEIQEILEDLEDEESPEIGEDVYNQVRYDLCKECRERFMKNPLGRALTRQFDFSEN